MVLPRSNSRELGRQAVGADNTRLKVISTLESLCWCACADDCKERR